MGSATVIRAPGTDAPPTPPPAAVTGDIADAMRRGLAAALAAGAWLLAFDRRIEHPWSTSTVAAVAAIALLTWPWRARGKIGRFGQVLLVVASLVAALAAADQAFSFWEERDPRFPGVAAVAARALHLFGWPASAEAGVIHVEHPDGLLSIAVSPDTLALRALGLFVVALAVVWAERGIRPAAAAAALGLAVAVAAGLVRYFALLLVYLEHDAVLAGDSGLAAFDLMRSPPITCGALLVAGLLAGRLMALGSTDPAVPAYLATRREAVGPAVLLAGLALIAGFAATFKPPGPAKAGRVLIDDRFCGIWEPTARQLDTNWFGDFPTYSFTSLAEWLGRWYAVDVNTDRPYEEGLLDRYDVLVIKTPEQPIPVQEARAIERFVQRGGGLLLVGDHTNLLGMGTHLNALSAAHGLRFRYDAVSDGPTGGFADAFGPLVRRHPGALHVEHLQFMTSCSLEISGNAEAVLAVDDCRREPHDYAGGSFFGRRGAHPELAHGRTVLAAVAPVGRGRIAAFTDSTVWSSFAAFSNDRDALAMDLLGLLNRAPSRLLGPFRLAAMAAALGALAAGWRLARKGGLLPALALALGGGWAGVAAADMSHRAGYAWPAPHEAPAEVSFLWQGGACAFPPVLGTPDSVPLDRSYDTLLVSVQRLGLVPRVAYSYDDMPRPATRAVVVVAPVQPPPPDVLERLRRFVRAGGQLVVFDDSRIGRRGSAAALLDAFDATVTYHDAEPGRPRHVHVGGLEAVSIPGGAAFVARRSVGRGQVVYAWDAADFSREGLGHCFARPWRAARARYEAVFALFRDVLGIAPTDRRFYGILGAEAPAGENGPDARTPGEAPADEGRRASGAGKNGRGNASENRQSPVPANPG